MTVCNVYSCKEPLIIGRKSVFLLKTSLSSRICYITHTYIQHTRSNARSLYLHSLSTLEITSFYLLCETLANRSDYRSLNLASISLVKRLTSLQSNPFLDFVLVPHSLFHPFILPLPLRAIRAAFY